MSLGCKIKQEKKRFYLQHPPIPDSSVISQVDDSSSSLIPTSVVPHFLYLLRLVLNFEGSGLSCAPELPSHSPRVHSLLQDPHSDRVAESKVYKYEARRPELTAGCVLPSAGAWGGAGPGGGQGARAAGGAGAHRLLPGPPGALAGRQADVHIIRGTQRLYGGGGCRSGGNGNMLISPLVAIITGVGGLGTSQPSIPSCHLQLLYFKGGMALF